MVNKKDTIINIIAKKKPVYQEIKYLIDEYAYDIYNKKIPWDIVPTEALLIVFLTDPRIKLAFTRAREHYEVKWALIKMPSEVTAFTYVDPETGKKY